MPPKGKINLHQHLETDKENPTLAWDLQETGDPRDQRLDGLPCCGVHWVDQNNCRIRNQVDEKKRVGYNLWTAYAPGPGDLTSRILCWYGPEHKFFRLWRYTRQMGLRIKKKEAMKKLRG